MTPDQFTRAQLRAQLRQRGYSEPQIIGAVDAAMAHTRVTDFGARVLIACRHAGRPLGRHQPFISTTRAPAPQAFDATHPTGYSSTMLVWALDHCGAAASVWRSLILKPLLIGSPPSLRPISCFSLSCSRLRMMRHRAAQLGRLL